MSPHEANAKILWPEENFTEIIISKDTSFRPHKDQASIVRLDLSKILLTGDSSGLAMHTLELLLGETARLLHDPLRDAPKREETSGIAQAREEESARRAMEEEMVKKTQEL